MIVISNMKSNWMLSDIRKVGSDDGKNNNSSKNEWGKDVRL